MGLITTIEDLQKYTRVNISVMTKSFIPYLNDATGKFLVPYLGETLLNELTTYSTDNTAFPAWADTDEKKNILSSVLYASRNALAKFTCFLSAPAFDLHLTEMGFVVQQNANSSPASSERVRKMVASLETQGWDNMETLLRLLEKHSNSIASYKDNDAFVFAHKNLINSASTFDRFFHINASRLTFIKLRPEMDNVEILNINPVISDGLSALLIAQQRTNALTPANKILLELLQRSVANFVGASHFNKPECLVYATRYLREAEKLLYSKPDDYPLFTESDIFNSARQSYAFHVNEKDSPNFIFGG